MDEKFWREAPKTYCDDSNMAVMAGTIGDMFLLALRSGANAQIFALTPGHVKRFSQLINFNVKNFEEKNGPIKVDDWTPEIKAPFQVQDIKKGK